MGYCLSVVLEVLTEWKAERHQGKEYFLHCYLKTEYNQSHPMMTETAIHGNPSRNTALAREMELELELE
jgi:hypothetical protein